MDDQLIFKKLSQSGAGGKEPVTGCACGIGGCIPSDNQFDRDRTV